jgi:hypothetical protein
MLGREATTPLQLLTPPPDGVDELPTWVESLQQNFQEAHQRVQEHYGKQQRLQKSIFDRRQRDYNFEEGDAVWFLKARPKRGVPYKLNPDRWEGPCTVKKRISAAVYVICLPGKTKSQVVTTARLRPYIMRPERLCPPMEKVEEDLETVKEADEEGGTPEVEEDLRPAEIENDYWPPPSKLTVRPTRNRRLPAKFRDYVLYEDGDTSS